jgi:hypothetical protein
MVNHAGRLYNLVVIATYHEGKMSISKSNLEVISLG